MRGVKRLRGDGCARSGSTLWAGHRFVYLRAAAAVGGGIGGAPSDASTLRSCSGELQSTPSGPEQTRRSSTFAREAGAH
eukprot:2337682-Pyramimonas_sp.AAC.1